MLCLRVAMAAALAVLATGCVVPSLQPLVDARSAVAEPRLLGRWVTSNNPALYDIRSADDGSYSVTAIAEGGKRAEYRLRCGSISGHTVIDLFPLDRGGYQSWDFLPLHSAFAVDFTEAGMQLSALNPGWLDAHTAGQLDVSMPLRISAAMDASVPVFSGPTQELRALYEEQLGNPEAFHEFTALTRLPDLAQLHEITKTLVAAQMAYYAKNGTYADSLAKLAAPPVYIDSTLASGRPLPGSRIAIKSGDADRFLLYVLDDEGRGYSANETGVVRNLLEDEALNAARTVAAGQFAFYAATGRYAATLQELEAAPHYVSAEIASGRLASGITVSLRSAGAAAFSVHVILPDGQAFSIDQSGEISPIEVAAPLDESYRRPALP